MSSPSLKELTKSLHSTFSIPSSPLAADGLYKSRELPPEIQQTIQAYLNKHTSLDDNDSQRLHEELSAIYNKNVASDTTKLAAFLKVLRQLRPLLNGQARLHEWWELVIESVIDRAGHKKDEIEHAIEFLLGILDYDADADTTGEKAKLSGHFTKLLLDLYLQHTRIPDADAEALNSEDDFLARQLEGVLIVFGRKKPKDFIQAIDRLVVDKSHRMQALGLLSAFVRQQPPHLYLVSQTPLIEHLLKCLMIDTSSTVISLALACLIMFLPHIPSSVKAHLPRLFLIYSRILCWERFFPSTPVDGSGTPGQGENIIQNGEDSSPKEAVAEDEDWEKLQSSFDNAESTAPELIHYFTFLYGLYPLNFISYIRKPRRYLKDIKFPRAEDFDLDQAIIRSRTEQFRRVHLIHPNFYNTTAEDELTDNRWLKSDPSDVVSECMNLCIATPALAQDTRATTAVPDVAPQFLRTEDIPGHSLLESEDELPLLSRPIEDVQSETLAPSSAPSSRPADEASHQSQGTPSTHSPAASSPAARPLDSISESPATPAAKHQSKIYLDTVSNRQSSMSSFPTSVSNQSPRVGPVSRSQMPRSPAVRPASRGEANLAFLQREVMLLRNELNFERYLKQQQLAHIGQLQRRHIAEATVEAETQNLINTNRALKARLAKANDAYASIKKEAATGRSQAKKWEAELTSRVGTLFASERRWKDEADSLRLEIARTSKDCDHLRQLVVDSESRELLAKQELIFAGIKLEKLDSLKAQVKEAEERILEYQAKDLLSAQRRDENEALKEQLVMAKMMMQSRVADEDGVKERFDQRCRELEAQLHAAQNPTANGPPGQLAPHVQAMLDNAVAPVTAKHDALRDEIEDLKKRLGVGEAETSQAAIS